MKTVMFLTLLGLFLHETTAGTHSLQHFYTGSSEVPNFPEFVDVCVVDGLQVNYYDSNIRRKIPKQDWANRVTEVRADFWEHFTQVLQNAEQTFKANIDILKQRFNQTGGVHIVQEMYGCEWDDETGEVKGYIQDGYDGEDFINLDFKTMTWVAPRLQAVVTKNRWNNDKAFLESDKQYLTQICVDWLKKYVDYGKSSLMRTDLPTVSLLQKSPSSRITCHATGFYPNRAVMFWRKDGEELHEGVDQGEILPNPDGSFQMSADLEPPSGDWEKYDCVFQLAGVEEDIVTRLEKREIKTNYIKTWIKEDHTSKIVPGIIVIVLIIIGCRYSICRWRIAKCPPSFAAEWLLAAKCPPSSKRPPSPVSYTSMEQPMIEKPPPTETPASA